MIDGLAARRASKHEGVTFIARFHCIAKGMTVFASNETMMAFQQSECTMTPESCISPPMNVAMTDVS